MFRSSSLPSLGTFLHWPGQSFSGGELLVFQGSPWPAPNPGVTRIGNQTTSHHHLRSFITGNDNHYYGYDDCNSKRRIRTSLCQLRRSPSDACLGRAIELARKTRGSKNAVWGVDNTIRASTLDIHTYTTLAATAWLHLTSYQRQPWPIVIMATATVTRTRTRNPRVEPPRRGQ